jgi:rhs family protein
MGNFEIKKAKLQEVLNKFKKISGDLESLGNNVKSEYTDLLANYWTGEGANQFRTNSDAWSNNLNCYNESVKELINIIESQAIPGANDIDNKATGIEGVVGGLYSSGSSDSVVRRDNCIEVLKSHIKHVMGEYYSYKNILEIVDEKLSTLDYSDLDVGGDISDVKAKIDDRMDKLNSLISALEDYESYVDCFEESISAAISKIKGPTPWENLKADNLLQIVSLLGAKGLKDYEYEKKAGNLILTVNGGKITLCAYGGDPINMSTGNYVYAGEFLSQKGLFPIAFNITYNSVDRNNASLGVGFYSDIDMRMDITESKAKITYSDGRREVFIKDKTGSYINISENGDILRKLGNRYELKTFEGNKHIFDIEGKLTETDDGKGNSIIYTYDGERLISKRSNSNEYIEYLYDDNKVVRVCDGNGRSVNLLYKDDNLSCIKNELGRSISFEYENGFITKLTDYEGKVTLENRYDEDGRITSQRFADGVELKFKYDKNSVTFNNGESEIVYYHDEGYRTVKITENGVSSLREFDKDGLCIFDIDRKGNKTIYEYNSDKKLIKVELPENIIVDLSYDSVGYLNGIKVNGEERLKQFNDVKGNPVEIFNASNERFDIVYNENSRPLKITAPDKSVMNISYDSSGNVTEIANDTVKMVGYKYDELNRVVSIEDNNGGKRLYKYNELGDITEVTNSFGEKRTYKYTANRQVSELKDFDGKTYEVEYNNINLPVKLKDKNGNTTEYVYDNIRRISQIKRADGVEKFEYDKRGNMTKMTAPDGSMKSFSYDDNRNIVSVTHPTGLSESYKYDKLNRCISKKFSDGVKSDFIYDGDRLIEMILPSGSIRYEYDECGRVSKQTLDENVSESFVYDSMNRVSEYTDIYGNVSSYEYNQNGRVKAVNIGDDVKYIYDYDKLGRTTAESRLVGDTENKVYYDYDDLGRVSGIRTDTGRENTYSYDNEGNITSIKDSIGNTNYFKYGVGNTLEKVVDGDGLVSEYSYDKMYNLVGIRQYKKGNENDCMIRSYHRNNMGRIFKIENADNTYKTLDYNSLGQVVKNIDEDGFKTELKYNEAGLLTSMKCSDGNYVNYEYDGNRFLKAVSGSFGTMSFERDKKGLVKKALTTDGHSITYEYDKFGRTVAIVYPDGKKVSYNYDKRGRLIETVSGNEHIRLTYNSLGRIESREYSDGSKTFYEYNDIGSPTKITYSSDENVNIEYIYTYDLVGNKTGISINKNGSVKDYSYSYDEVGRITKVVLNDKMLREYSYDIFGNRTAKVDYTEEEVVTTNYIYKGGKLVEELIAKNNSLIQKRYEYDKRGNLIKKFAGDKLEAEYKYNGLGQLISVISGKNIVTYEYDGLGHRIGKTESNGNESHTTNYVIDIRKKTDNILWQNTDGNERSFVWDIQLISEVEDDNRANIICDELGSVILEGNELFEYSEFGEVLGSKPKNFGFAGLMVDDISGNYLSATRMYDENLGRFLGKDKIKGDIRYGFTQNEYTYCYNAPLIFVDSTGESPETKALRCKYLVKGVLDLLLIGISPEGYFFNEMVMGSLLRYIKWDKAVDNIANSGYNYWKEKVTDIEKDAISKDAYSSMKDIRKSAEDSGFSDKLNEMTRSSIADVILNSLDFYKDDKGVIHTMSLCWQLHWGYNDFYDFAFGSLTSMNRGKFKFGDGDDEFTLWMWKGDYFNFGAGGEIGIYKGKDWHVDCYTQSKLKMNLDIRLKDGTQVIDWDANDLYQWWITGFNPDKRFQDVKAEDLVMTGMVDFDEERAMWKEFVHTAEFDDQNVDKINDNWCLDFVHRNAVMKWKGGNKN